MCHPGHYVIIPASLLFLNVPSPEHELELPVEYRGPANPDDNYISWNYIRIIFGDIDLTAGSSIRAAEDSILKFSSHQTVQSASAFVAKKSEEGRKEEKDKQ